MSITACDDIQTLLSTLVADESDGDAATIETHLATCEACRRQIEAFFRQDRALAELAAETQLVEPLALRIREQLRGDANVRPAKQTKSSASVGWAILATAASLLIALGVWTAVRPGSVNLATLEVAEGRIVLIGGDGETAIEREHVLQSGSTLATVGEESLAVVRFADGTRLELGADTRITLTPDNATSGKRVVLSEGFLSADVAPQPAGRPMLLSTPQAELTVLGTKFHLSGGSEATYVETGEGSVHVTRKSDGQSVTVDGGFETSVSAKAGPLAAESLPTTLGGPRLNLDGFGQATLSPDGRTLAVAPYLNGDVEFLDVATGQMQIPTIAHRRRVHALAFSPDGAMLATGGIDETVKLWDRATGGLKATLDIDPGWIADLAFSPDGRTLAVLSSEEGSEERTVSFLDVKTGEPSREPLRFSAQRWAFSPSGTSLAAYDRRAKLITVWDLKTGGIRGRFASPVGNNVFSLAFEPLEAFLAIDGSSGVVVVCSAVLGNVVQRLERRGGRIFGMTFAPGGRTLATGHQDGTIRLWNVATTEQIAVSAGRSAVHARAVGFSPDGRMLLAREIRLETETNRRDGAVQIWDVERVRSTEY